MRRGRDPLIAVRLPAPLLAALDEEVRRRPRGVRGGRLDASRSAVVRDALLSLLERAGRKVSL